MKALEIFHDFVKAINAHDVPKLCRLMSDDHVFIDSMGTESHGREAMCKGWVAYFRIVPDYRIELRQQLMENDSVLAQGHAYGTFTSDGNLSRDNRWSVPSAWRAIIEGRQVALWQVFADNEPIRVLMRKERAKRLKSRE